MLNKREKIIFYIAAGTIISGIVLNFFVLPLFNKYSRLDRQVRLAGASLMRYTQLLDRQGMAKDRYNKIFSGPKAGGEKQDVAVEVLSRLEALAGAADIRIVYVRPQPGSGADTGEETLIELRAQARPEGYTKFIYGIEDPLSLLSIKSVQFIAKPGSDVLDCSFLIAGVSMYE